MALAAALVLQENFKVTAWCPALRRGIVAIAVAVSVAQLVIMPRTSAKASERALAGNLSARAGSGQEIFSCGYEFYGASFYSGRRFYRLPESDSPGLVGPVARAKAGDLLVYFIDDRGKAEENLKKSGLRLAVEDGLKLSKRDVEIARVVAASP
jgi:hypothetical protein